MATLKERLARPGSFVVATEIVTSRGLVSANGGGGVLELARELADDPRIDVLSITDNPGGNAMFSPDALGTDMISRGQEVIIHLACKDWNRNALESRGWQLGSAGFSNVLALSGDYPIMGHRGLAAPVFDIDSVGLLGLLAEMNEGLPDARKPDVRLDRTDFFLGCVVTNHKRHEREVMPQYFKLRKKAHAGARFVINQIGWDVRKDDELLRWIRGDGLELHALANVYLLSRPAARAFHQGKIPGVVVTDRLLELAERHGASPDKGRAFFVDLAAKHFAVARGLGFGGVYLGGHTPADDLRRDRRPRRRLRAGRLAIVRAGAPLSVRRRVLLLRARPRHGPLVRRRERRVPRVEAAAAHRPARPVHVPREPPDARRRLRPRGAAPPDRAGAVPRAREGAARRASRRARGRAGGQGGALRLPRLRRLLAARDRVRVPRVAVREEPAQRPVRRAPARGSARSTTASASGHRRTSASRPTARRSPCSTARWWSRTTRSPGRAPGRMPSSAAITSGRRARRDGAGSRPGAVDAASGCARALRGRPLPPLARGGARARVRGLPRPASLVDRRPRGLLGLALGLLRGQGGDTVRARAGLGRDAGRRLVPRRGAELRRACPGARGGPGHRRRPRPLADARTVRADVRRAPGAGRAGARGAAAARRRPGRPRRRVPAEHPRDARRVPGHRQPRRDLGDVRVRVRSAQRPRPARTARAEGPPRDRRLSLRRQGRRPPRAGGRGPGGTAVARARRPRSVCGRPRRRAARHDRLGRAPRRAGPPRVRPRPVRPPAVRALLLRHDRAAEGDRARARRHPARALQEPRALLRHPPRRPACSGSRRPHG